MTRFTTPANGPASSGTTRTRSRRRVAARPAVVILGALVASIVLARAPTVAAQVTDEVLSMRVHVDVARNGSIRVTEHVRVRADSIFRYGLVRYYETTRRRPDGFAWMQLPFEVRSATLDGTPANFRATSAGGPLGRSGLRVRAGGQAFLTGTHTFELVYETERRVDYGPLEDVLVWDVTGTGWDVPIREASVTLNIEGDVSPSTIAAWISPRRGADEPVPAVWDPATGASANATRQLEPGESFAISLRLPKWSIAAVQYHVERQWFWLDWRGWIEACWALGVVASIYVLMWLRVGRDPSDRLVVELSPPADLSPAAIGYLHGRRWHPRLYAAALVGLATRGAVRILRTADGWSVRRGDGTADLRGDERVVLRELLGTDHELALGIGAADRLARGAEALRRSLSTALERAFFLQNRRWFIAGLIASVVSLFVLAWRWRFDIESGSTFLAIVLAFWTLGTVSLGIRAAAFIGHAREGGSRTAYAWGAASAVAFLPFSVLGVGLGVGVLRMVPLHIVVAGLAIGITNGVFYHLLERPTLGGRALLARVEGFRHFLETVDSDRLVRLGAARDMRTFDRYLPHAIALGVERAWARRFNALLSPPGAFASVRGSATAWCDASPDVSDDPASLARELAEALNGARTAPGYRLRASASSSMRTRASRS